MTLTPRIDTIESRDKKNYIINGNFDFWQRGSGSSAGITSSAAYVCDRFVFRKSVGTGSVVRQFKNGSDGSQGYSTQLFSDTADGGAGFAQMGTQIEKRMMRDIIGKEVTLHFQAKGLNTNAASLNNEVIIYFRNDVADGDVKFGANQTSYLIQPVTLAGTSFETVSFTFTVPADTQAMFIQFGGNNLETYGSGDGFAVKEFMLNEGIITEEFTTAGRNYMEELQLCQRYYEVVGDTVADFALSRHDAGGYRVMGATFTVEKREIPVVLMYWQRSNVTQTTLNATSVSKTSAYRDFGGSSYVDLLKMEIDAEL